MLRGAGRCDAARARSVGGERLHKNNAHPDGTAEMIQKFLVNFAQPLRHFPLPRFFLAPLNRKILGSIREAIPKARLCNRPAHALALIAR